MRYRLDPVLFLGCLALMAALIGCPPPEPDPAIPNVPFTSADADRAIPVGTACAQVVVACMDEFAHQPINLVCYRETARWSQTALTWRVVPPAPNIDVDAQTAAAAWAFGLWADASGLTFTQVDGDADITISFDAGDPYPFDGPGNNLGYAFFPGTDRAGQVHLSDIENWSLSPGDAMFDIATVVLHEVGHALGLGHSTSDEDVMAPSYPATGWTALGSGDVQAIRNLYGAAGESLPAIPALGEGFCADVGNLTAMGDPDSDGDGIPDTIETYALRTDPYSADTDGDGTNDALEAFNEIADLLSDPLQRDTDGDGATDGLDSAPDNLAVGGAAPASVGGPPQVNAQLLVNGNEVATIAVGDGVSTIIASSVPEIFGFGGYYQLVMQNIGFGEVTDVGQIALIIDSSSVLTGSPIDVTSLAGMVQVGFADSTGAEGAYVATCNSTKFPCYDETGTASGAIALRLAGGRLVGSFDINGIDAASGGSTVRAMGTIDIPENYSQIGDLPLDELFGL